MTSTICIRFFSRPRVSFTQFDGLIYQTHVKIVDKNDSVRCIMHARNTKSCLPHGLPCRVTAKAFNACTHTHTHTRCARTSFCVFSDAMLLCRRLKVLRTSGIIARCSRIVCGREAADGTTDVGRRRRAVQPLFCSNERIYQSPDPRCNIVIAVDRSVTRILFVDVSSPHSASCSRVLDA
jgi:hypothetical protein